MATEGPYGASIWPDVRRRTLRRFGGRCQLRMSPKCRGTANVAHHIVDWRDGGAWFEDSNLTAVCVACNNAAAARRRAAALRRERGEPIPPGWAQEAVTAPPSRDW